MDESRVEDRTGFSLPVERVAEIALPASQPWVRWQARVAASSDVLAQVGLVAALVVGGFLRLWQINGFGFNADEAVYAGQAAAIVGDPTLKPFFPMFRAHPLLFQFMVSLVYQLGVSDVGARILSAVLGVVTIYVVYLLGDLLYGRKAGVLAALFIGLMTYHVLVTRQMILDGPMTLAATLTLYLLARFAASQQPPWLWAVGAGLGLTFLAKETGIILIGAVYVFLALSPEIRLRLRDLALSLLSMIVVIAMFPLSITLAGAEGSRKAQSYLLWQLFRTPNHDWSFYPTVVPLAIGPLVILAAAIGLWVFRRRRTWREALLLAWIAVPVFFFQLWPVKGYQYLLPTAPAIALLAARALTRWPRTIVVPAWRRRVSGPWLQTAAVMIVLLSLVIPTWQRVQATTAGPLLAGSGGVPAGREAGRWLDANVPAGAQVLTIGPSMANILMFYGHRKAFGLSVSTNPLRRNPSYQPVRNPDLQIRQGEFQYLVYDAFSASRSQHFADKLIEYARRFNGRVVHTESLKVRQPDGSTALQPVIIVYEVRP